MAKRDATCPLCGAKLAPEQILDACEEVVGPGVLECHCPYCQGRFEVRPVADALEIGYQQGSRFDVVITLPAIGLAVLRDTTTNASRLKLAGRDWKFAA